nr:reverse transcriptase domain-containing protein [Tanacetum cinerariifolium]
TNQQQSANFIKPKEQADCSTGYKYGSRQTTTDDWSDYDYEIRYHPGKANVIADALSRKEREPPLRVRALVRTIGLDLLRQILNAQTKARKPENINKEDVRGMLVENSRDSEKELATLLWRFADCDHA